MRRLFDVSVSILMAAVLLVSQTWAVTAAYADYSINGFASSNDSVLDGSAATQDGLVSEEQKSDGTPENIESQNVQLASSEEASGAIAADSTESNLLTVKNVSVSAHVQNIGWMNPVGSGKVAGTTGRGLNLEALKISLEVDGPSSQEQVANALSVEAHVAGIGWQPAVGNGGTAGTARPVPRRRGPEGQAVRRAVCPLHRLVPRPLRRVRLAGLGVRRRRGRIGGLRPRRPGRPGRGPAQGRPRPGRHRHALQEPC